MFNPVSILHPPSGSRQILQHVVPQKDGVLGAEALYVRCPTEAFATRRAHM